MAVVGGNPKRCAAMRPGLTRGFSLKITDEAVTNVFAISQDSFVAVAGSELIRFSQRGVYSRTPMRLSAALFIPSINVLVAVSRADGAFLVYDRKDFANPILSGPAVEQDGVFKLIYSKRSQFLISIGAITRIWRLCADHGDATLRPRFSISAYATLTQSFSPDQMDSITYDPECRRFIDVQEFVPSGSEKKLLASFRPRSNFLATSQDSDSLSIWGGSKEEIGTFSIGCERIVFLKFLNKQFVCVVGSDDRFHLLDVGLMSLFECGRLQLSGSSLFLSVSPRPVLVSATASGTITVSFICLPYRLWTTLPCPATAIERCNRNRAAARLMVFLSDKSVSLFSPSTREQLRKVAISQESAAVSCFYDRNLVASVVHDFSSDRHDIKFRIVSEDHDRDILVVPTCDDGTARVSPPRGSAVVHECVCRITLCCRGGNWMYAAGTSHGEIVLFDYITFSEVSRYKIAFSKVLNLSFHRPESLLLFFGDQMLRFDLKTECVVESLSLRSACVCAAHGDLIFVGTTTGSIETFIVHQTLKLADRSMTFHEDYITGMSFARDYFISCSRDHFLKYWDYQFHSICEIWFPFPLLNCVILNGKRDVLVATETALLIVSGRTVFADQVDIYESQIDNFDMLKDPLSKVNEAPASDNDDDKQSGPTSDPSDQIEQTTASTPIDDGIVEQHPIAPPVEASGVRKHQRKQRAIRAVDNPEPQPKRRADLAPPVEMAPTSPRRSQFAKVIPPRIAPNRSAEATGTREGRDAGSRRCPTARTADFDLDAIFEDFDGIRFPVVSRNPVLIDVRTAKIQQVTVPKRRRALR
jgi:WD40 repeat protein